MGDALPVSRSSTIAKPAMDLAVSPASTHTTLILKETVLNVIKDLKNV